MNSLFSKNRTTVALVLLILTMVCLIEARYPYYFLQDDNRVFYLPFYVHNLRALLGREFPLYNFHQYLGMPVTIQYAAFYPPNYLALLFSKILTGHYFLGMEFLACFHLIITGLGMYRLLRIFRLHEASCFFGSVAWTFCGFVIIVGNSWIQFIGFAAYLPWITFCAFKLVNRFELRYFLLSIIFKVLALFLGYPQMFLYTITFEMVSVVMFYLAKQKSGAGHDMNQTGDHPVIRAPSAGRLLLVFACTYLSVLIIAMPLILQTLQQVGVSANRKQALSWDTYAAWSYDLSTWLKGLIAPFAHTDVATQFELHYISHVGYLTLLFIVIALVALVRAYVPFKDVSYDSANLRDRRNEFGSDRKLILGLLLMALLALLWSGDTIITRIVYYIPYYNRMRFPFKVAFFANFYLVMISAFGFEAFLRRIKSWKALSSKVIPVCVVVILLCHGANFLLVYTASPQRMFSRHFDQVPFDEPLRQMLQSGRIVSAGLDDVWDGNKIVPGFSAPLLGFDYATLWGLYHFGGYDPMVSAKNQAAAFGIKENPVFNLPADEPFFIPPETLEYFRTWGVKWYVVSKAIPLAHDTVFQLLSTDKYRYILADPLAKPLIFWPDRTAQDIRYRFTTNSVVIDYDRESDGNLIVNVLYNPKFTAMIDGAVSTVVESDAHQVSIAAPKGRHEVVLKYTDRIFIYASIVSLLFMSGLLACVSSAKFRCKVVEFMA